MKSIARKRSTEAQPQSFLTKAYAPFLILTLLISLYLFFEVFVLVFNAVLIAVLLRMIARPFKERLRLSNWAALSLAGLLLLGVAGGSGYLFGTRLAFDIQDILARMELAQHDIRAQLESSPLGNLVLSRLGTVGIPVTQIIASIFSISASVIAGIVLSVIAGVYLAAEPSLYLQRSIFPIPMQRSAEASTSPPLARTGCWRCSVLQDYLCEATAFPSIQSCQ